MLTRSVSQFQASNFHFQLQRGRRLPLTTRQSQLALRLAHSPMLVRGDGRRVCPGLSKLMTVGSCGVHHCAAHGRLVSWYQLSYPRSQGKLPCGGFKRDCGE